MKIYAPTYCISKANHFIIAKQYPLDSVVRKDILDPLTPSKKLSLQMQPRISTHVCDSRSQEEEEEKGAALNTLTSRRIVAPRWSRTWTQVTQRPAVV